MSGIDTALVILYEASSRKNSIQQLSVRFKDAMASLPSHYEKHRMTLEDFFEEMAEAHGSAHQLKMIAEEVENWQRAHFPSQ